MDANQAHPAIDGLLQQCDQETQSVARRTLDYIHRQINLPAVNANIRRIASNTPGVAFYLAEEAYSHNNNNVFFLTLYASYLKARNEPDRAVEVINEFGMRVPIDDLGEESRIIVKITLASCHNDMTAYEESIKILQTLPLDGVPGKTRYQPREVLAETYYLRGDLDKAWELAQNAPELTPNLRIVQARIYIHRREIVNAMTVLEPIKDNPRYPKAGELYRTVFATVEISRSSATPTPGVRMTTPRLFISHSSQDEQVAATLVDLLETALSLQPGDIRCTSVVGYKLPTGAHTSTQLRDEIYGAEIIMGVITPNSLQSSYVLFELGASWGLSKPTFPLLALGADVSMLRGPLKEQHASRLYNRAEIQQVIDDIVTHTRIQRQQGQGVAARVEGKIDSLLRAASETA